MPRRRARYDDGPRRSTRDPRCSRRERPRADRFRDRVQRSLSGSSLSSWILRVSVLRPQPSHCAASERRPPVWASARRISVRSNSFSSRPPLRARRARAPARARDRAPVASCLRRHASLRRCGSHIRRQIGRVDALPRRHHRQPVADVLELAHVAGKVECRQQLQRCVGELLRLDRELARALAQEMPRQRRDVLAALAQRRQAQANDVEPVHQVFAKQPLPHALVQILVRCRDDAHVGLQRCVAADAVVFAVGKHAQQAHLQVRRHVADLVEEQRAAFGLLEAAAARALRAGECTALVAEQFGFQQVLRYRRGVDRDERRRGARAVPVQRARDQLLAGARFAGDQHRRVRMRQPSDRAKNFLHRRRLPEHLGCVGDRLRAEPPSPGLRRSRGGSARPRDRRRTAWAGTRSPALERRDGAVEIRVRGHDDHRHVADDAP